MSEPGPVVVGVDGSSDASHTLETAILLAGSIGSELVAVHALGLMTVIDGRHVPSFDHREDVDRMLREQWCAPIEAAGLPHRIELHDGNPTEVLVHLADMIDPSFLVVGARGIGENIDRELGSTSFHVMRHASCPVVVVPRPAG